MSMNLKGLHLALVVTAIATLASGLARASELIPTSVLAWDAEYKQHNAKVGETNVAFTFWVTNVCPTNVLILNVETSCGCAALKTPKLPWIVAPSESGSIMVNLDLRGRRGALFKGVHITSSAGVRSLVVRINIPPDPATTNTPSTNAVSRPIPRRPKEGVAQPPPRKW